MNEDEARAEDQATTIINLERDIDALTIANKNQADNLLHQNSVILNLTRQLDVFVRSAELALNSGVEIPEIPEPVKDNGNAVFIANVPQSCVSQEQFASLGYQLKMDVLHAVSEHINTEGGKSMGPECEGKLSETFENAIMFKTGFSSCYVFEADVIDRDFDRTTMIACFGFIAQVEGLNGSHIASKVENGNTFYRY